jgi:hypothetical protein
MYSINAVDTLAGLGLGSNEVAFFVIKSSYLAHCSRSDDLFMLIRFVMLQMGYNQPAICVTGEIMVGIPIFMEITSNLRTHTCVCAL